jgi:A/G-specific adenine glycosylase
MTEAGMAQSDDGFAVTVVDWQRRFGRHHLPWQNIEDPYRIWLSEIMLQQTQVSAVVPYFERFVARFPTLEDLASATEDAVLSEWSGLGYYARGRNLHRAAQRVLAEHGGRFPERFEDILHLPGVGRSTAGAIAVFAFGQRFPILDGNVKRVLARCFGVEGYPGLTEVAARLWTLAEQLLPTDGIKAYTQGLMDLGAEVCRRSRPLCSQCPLRTRCVAHTQDRVAALPAPRPKKPRPQRAVVMLIMQCDGDVLMEKRPSPGIWGGLWSFPETENLGDATGVGLAVYGLEVQSVTPMTPIVHGFTHFSLTITPALCRVSAREMQAQAPGRVWTPPDEALQKAIPVPVRKIVDQLSHSPRSEA